jgi:hypothetical protein
MLSGSINIDASECKPSTPALDLSSEVEVSAVSGTEKVLYTYLRKRSQGEFHAYGLTTVKQLASGGIVHLKCIISARMYCSLVATKQDHDRHVVKQCRYCFRYQDQAFHISHQLKPEVTDTSTSTSDDLWLAVIQSEAQPLLPSFLSLGPELNTTATRGDEFSFQEMSAKL